MDYRFELCLQCHPELMIFIRQHDIDCGFGKISISTETFVEPTNSRFLSPFLWTIASNNAALQFLVSHSCSGCLINLDGPDSIERVVNWANSNRKEASMQNQSFLLAKEELNR